MEVKKKLQISIFKIIKFNSDKNYQMTNLVFKN